MAKKRFTEEQIIGVIKQHEPRVKVDDTCRQRGISKQTLFHWKSKYAGLEDNEAKRPRDLESENAELKRLFFAEKQHES